MNLSDHEAEALRKVLPLMPSEEKMEVLTLLDEFDRRKSLKKSKSSVLAFAHHVYPNFKEGAHHRKLAKIFEDVVAGRKKRVIINIAPRMGKSEFLSYLFPAWFLGQFPDKKIIMGTHTASLSEDFGRRVKIWWILTNIRRFFQKQPSQKTKKLPENGLPELEVNIMLLALAALWLGVVLICLLLTILILNRI